jgi:UDP-N-acetylglucosamine--N-acetylmuramyl-(pentapeptide) pyrophosphoryl-undecaprenol N-acetylglucosamine transferase
MTHTPVRILITGGGTGGHVYPGLAVAKALEKLAPGSEVRFAGTSRGIESVLVPKAGYRLAMVPASGLRGLGGRARLMFLWNFFLGFFRSLLMLIVWRPRAVLGTGGYVSAPVMLAARVLGIACALQEQYAIPGSTNRLVARWARRIYLGFGSAARYFKADRCLETGNPVREEFLAAQAVRTP